MSELFNVNELFNDGDRDIKVNGFTLWKKGTICKICGKPVNIYESYRLSAMHMSCFHKAVSEGKMNIMDFWDEPSAFHNKNAEKMRGSMNKGGVEK